MGKYVWGITAWVERTICSQSKSVWGKVPQVISSLLFISCHKLSHANVMKIFIVVSALTIKQNFWICSCKTDRLFQVYLLNIQFTHSRDEGLI